LCSQYGEFATPQAQIFALPPAIDSLGLEPHFVCAYSVANGRATIIANKHNFDHGLRDQLLGGHALDFSDANLSQKKHLHRAGSSDGSLSAKIGGAGALGIQLQSMTASKKRDAT
jgi:hypothetical protein